MNTNNGPCPKDCPDRGPECHGKCERYQEFAREREKLRAEKLSGSAYALYRNDRYIKNLKRRNKNKR